MDKAQKPSNSERMQAYLERKFRKNLAISGIEL
jgi:hypothetical protein